MRYIKLDAEETKSRKGAHEYLAAKLKFQDYYGNNLDALYDCLTEVAADTSVAVPRKISEKGYLGDYGEKMLAAFCDAAEANKSLEVTII
ncbi:MAG: barstar family protein [Phascolarctobacterium sp.]|nr:barstar family protein [Phascolarctobacterium sp.]